MKKLCLLAVAVAGVMLSSCGGSRTKAIKTDLDSLAYAFGVETAADLFQFDSTMNIDIYVQAVKDYFENTSSMTYEQARSYIGYYIAVGRAKRNEEMSKKWFDEVLAKRKNVQTTPSGLYYVIEKEGQEPKVQFDDTVTVAYTLRSSQGIIFDASGSDRAYTFVPSSGTTVAGFAEGVTLAGKGGKLTLFVPWELAYGDLGTGGIEPKQSLQFDVEILDIKHAAK